MSELVNYTVLQEAIVLQTGQINPENKKPEVVRAVKGQTFNAPPDNPSVVTFLGMKAIRPTAEATGNEHVTALSILRAFKSEVTGDVKKDVEPVDAPLPVEGPDALLR